MSLKRPRTRRPPKPSWRSGKSAAQETSAPVVRKALSLNDLFSRVQAGEVKELPIILKADVQGSIEPIVNQLDSHGSISSSRSGTRSR